MTADANTVAIILATDLVDASPNPAAEFERLVAKAMHYDGGTSRGERELSAAYREAAKRVADAIRVKGEVERILDGGTPTPAAAESAA